MTGRHDRDDGPGAAVGVAVGMDIGRRLTKVVVVRGAQRREIVAPTPHPAPGDSIVDAVGTAVDDLEAGTGVPGPRRMLAAVPAGRRTAAEAAEDAALLGSLAGALGFRQGRQADTALCLAASVRPTAGPGPGGAGPDGAGPDGADPGLLLVCDVGAGTVVAALCAHDGAGLRLLGQEVDADLGTLGMHWFEDELARVTGLVPPGGSGPGHRLGGGRALPPSLVHEQVRHARRAELVLDRAARHDRYRRTPVFFPDRSSGLTADAVRNLLDPVGARAAAVVGRLCDRAWEPPDGATLVLTGGFANLQPIRDAVVAALAPHSVRWAPGRASSPPGVLAAAAGAANLAAGTVVVQSGYPRSLRLRARRVRRGLLEAVDLPVVSAGAPVQRQVIQGGEPVTVTVDPADVGSGLGVQIRDDTTGDWHDLPVGNGVRLAAGTYRLGVRPGRSPLGLLALEPVDGGRPVVVPLHPTAGGRT